MEVVKRSPIAPHTRADVNTNAALASVNPFSILAATPSHQAIHTFHHQFSNTGVASSPISPLPSSFRSRVSYWYRHAWSDRKRKRTVTVLCFVAAVFITIAIGQIIFVRNLMNNTNTNNNSATLSTSTVLPVPASLRVASASASNNVPRSANSTGTIQTVYKKVGIARRSFHASKLAAGSSDRIKLSGAGSKGNKPSGKRVSVRFADEDEEEEEIPHKSEQEHTETTAAPANYLLSDYHFPEGPHTAETTATNDSSTNEPSDEPAQVKDSKQTLKKSAASKSKDEKKKSGKDKSDKREAKKAKSKPKSSSDDDDDFSKGKKTEKSSQNSKKQISDKKKQDSKKKKPRSKVDDSSNNDDDGDQRDKNAKKQQKQKASSKPEKKKQEEKSKTTKNSKKDEKKDKHKKKSKKKHSDDDDTENEDSQNKKKSKRQTSKTSNKKKQKRQPKNSVEDDEEDRPAPDKKKTNAKPVEKKQSNKESSKEKEGETAAASKKKKMPVITPKVIHETDTQRDERKARQKSTWISMANRNLGSDKYLAFDADIWKDPSAHREAHLESDRDQHEHWVLPNDVALCIFTTGPRHSLLKVSYMHYLQLVANVIVFSDHEDAGLGAVVLPHPHPEYQETQPQKYRSWMIGQALHWLAQARASGNGRLPLEVSFVYFMQDSSFPLLDQVHWRMQLYRSIFRTAGSESVYTSDQIVAAGGNQPSFLAQDSRASNNASYIPHWAYGVYPGFIAGRPTYKEVDNTASSMWQEQSGLVNKVFNSASSSSSSKLKLKTTAAYFFGMSMELIEKLDEFTDTSKCPVLIPDDLAIAALLHCADIPNYLRHYDWLKLNRQNPSEANLDDSENLNKWRAVDVYSQVNSKANAIDAQNAYYPKLAP